MSPKVSPKTIKKIDKLYAEADKAYYAEDLEKAEELYKQVLELDPDHQPSIHSIGIVHYDRDEYGPAIEFMRRALELDPEDQYVHSNLGKSLYGLHHYGEEKKARKIAKKWAAEFPENEIAQHMSAAVLGGDDPSSAFAGPERANDAYVAQTFDEFADSFDDKLAELNYKAPELIAKALEKIAPKWQALEKLNIMDAGCGTGLCAPYLAPMAARLDGVDLSKEMIGKAKKRKLYTRLDKGELSAVLDKRKRRYDLVVAADVLCYFGALGTVLNSFHHCLREDGCLAFSLEVASEEDLAEADEVASFALHISGRYVHSRRYIKEAVSEAGFSIKSMAKKTLRTEYGEPVKGVVVVAMKQSL